MCHMAAFSLCLAVWANVSYVNLRDRQTQRETDADEGGGGGRETEKKGGGGENRERIKKDRAWKGER